ncbi:hypothetical protein PM10SUCC1_33460 [Propionigenium maris DSM 9537]|uniref:Uncharacterized protein n=1 Tax=Propionigenium maris DSM 9537 TaxID=1123000 RepID=A0A9W6GNT4_9FUSO|nr:hypothetical protein [Propionigenium maris]GLI57832.1 hypothetical protein PM10SUCC1_33460 [Propionigenium maris DSM 9537]
MFYIRYNDFKVKEKYDLKTKKDGSIEKNPQGKPLFHLEKGIKSNLEIPLTKKNSKTCDEVNISNYNSNGDITDSCFIFYHYCPDDKKHYRISVENKKEKNFLKRLMKPTELDRWWNVDIDEISGKDGTKKIDCHDLGKGHRISLLIKTLLEDPSLEVREKIVELIRRYRYQKVIIKKDNMMLCE